MQLNLFEHAPRHYHESLARLGRVDLDGCLEALARHRSSSPAGPDPEPVEGAAAWLASRVPNGEDPPGDFGRAVLELCRALRRGEPGIPALLMSRGELVKCVTRSLAHRALEQAQAAEIPPEAPVDGSLPWGVFRLFADQAREARTALLTFLRTQNPSAEACLALGEASLRIGREQEASRAWREGFGLDPSGHGWAPMPTAIEKIRGEYLNDPLFQDDWWAVGAYLEGRFPRYERAHPTLVVHRWQRFLQARSQQEVVAAPALFFAGLFLSEHGMELPANDLRLVRDTLIALHPEAYEFHRGQLEELGPPRPFLGREYMAW